MLKDTRLLIGLGIGLIIGALLLQLMNVAVNGVNQNSLLNNNDVLASEHTIEQLAAIAEALDYRIIEKSVKYYTQEEMDKSIDEAKKTMSSEQTTDNNKPIVKEPVVEQPVVEAPKAEPIVVKEVVKETYRIQIQSGMVTSDVTSLLLSSGLISDVASFEKELARRNLNKSIQIGTFEFDKKPSLTELINKITTQ